MRLLPLLLPSFLGGIVIVADNVSLGIAVVPSVG